jgi:hypothetical protein
MVSVKQKYDRCIIDHGKKRQKKKFPDLQFEKPEHKYNKIKKDHPTSKRSGVIQNCHNPESGYKYLEKSQTWIFELFIKPGSDDSVYRDIADKNS